MTGHDGTHRSGARPPGPGRGGPHDGGRPAPASTRQWSRQRELEPPLRWLPRLAMAQTRAFGLFSHDRDRTLAVNRAQLNRRPSGWFWGVWVAAACIPTLTELLVLRCMGWLASTSPHAVAEVRPLTVTRAERLKVAAIRLGTFLLELAVALAITMPLLGVMAAVHQLWLGVLVAALLAVATIPLVGDQVYRLKFASREPPPPVDQPACRITYLIAAFCADPQRGGWGSELGARLWPTDTDEPTATTAPEVTFILRARTPELVRTYAGFGFRLTDPERRVMVRQ